MSCECLEGGCSVAAVIRRIGLLVVALAFFSIAGGQWAVVQSVAWAEMLRDYTHQTGSVAVAVKQTFDGQHLCPLCRQIQAAKSQQRKESPAAPGAKDDAKVKAIAADPIPRPAGAGDALPSACPRRCIASRGAAVDAAAASRGAIRSVKRIALPAHRRRLGIASAHVHAAHASSPNFGF
jgi:hypothetical protein